MVFRYRPSGPGQPPQRLSPDGSGYCVETGARITHFAPERPWEVRAWRQYAHLGRKALRAVRIGFCHGCGRPHASSYAQVLCSECLAAL